MGRQTTLTGCSGCTKACPQHARAYRPFLLVLVLLASVGCTSSVSPAGADGGPRTLPDTAISSLAPAPIQSAADDCREGRSERCVDVGRYLLDLDDAIAKQRGAALLAHACSSGVTDVCREAAELYRGTRGVDADPFAARELLATACLTDVDPANCVAAAELEQSGEHGVENQLRALELYAEACNLGDLAACEAQAAKAASGVVSTAAVDWEEAYQAGELACLSGRPRACDHAARIAVNRRHVSEVWRERSTSRLEEACEVGAADACLTYGETLIAEEDDRSLRAALRVLDRGCELREARACFLAAETRRDRLSTTDRAQLEQARRGFARACQDGYTEACVAAADMMRDGVGGVRDAEGARAAYDDACGEGHWEACNTLAIMLRDGVGGEAELARASDLFRLACDMENMWSCLYLGDLHADGRISEGGERRALELFRQACEGGLAWGCVKVGEFYRTGRVVRRDPGQAFELFSGACSGGVAWGCNFAGQLMYEGEGVTQNRIRAIQYYASGCELDGRWGCLFAAEALLRGKRRPITPDRIDDDVERACRLLDDGCMTSGHEESCSLWDEVCADLSLRGTSARR